MLCALVFISGIELSTFDTEFRDCFLTNKMCDGLYLNFARVISSTPLRLTRSVFDGLDLLLTEDIMFH